MPEQWVQKLCGRFLVFEGPDGSGKSTQFRRFSQYLQDRGVGVCEVREPGGTQIGEQIRRVLLDPAHEMMDLRCEMMLYMASRAQLVAERIAPAIKAGACVLADRFVPSTLAYQGAAGGLPLEEIRVVADVAAGHIQPDLVILLDVDEQTEHRRLTPLLDRMELKGAEYHRKVRQGYLDQVKTDPQHYLVIDARPEADAVFQQLCNSLSRRF